MVPDDPTQTPMAAPTGIDKATSRLIAALQEGGLEAYNVVVTFSGELDGATLESLGLLGAGAGRAMGRLDAREVRAVLSRADVVTVDLEAAAALY